MADKTKFEVGKATHPGHRRDHNEDSLGFFVPEDPNQLAGRGAIYIVADGMGGHEAGAVASDRAWRKVIDEYYYGDPSLGIRESLERAITIANEEIYRLATQNPTWSGMGSTIVAAVLRGENELYVANVGDSRAYLVHGDEIRQITKDHSWVQQQVDAGIVSPEEAKVHPRRSAITRCLGRRPDVEVDIFDEEFHPGDKLVLCSDGLCDVVRDEEIKKAVSEYKPQEAVERMVDMANHRGGPDNITAIAIGYPKGGLAIAGPPGVFTKVGLGVGILAIVAMMTIVGVKYIFPPRAAVLPGPTTPIITLTSPSPMATVSPTPKPVTPTPTPVTPTLVPTASPTRGVALTTPPTKTPVSLTSTPTTEVAPTSTIATISTPPATFTATPPPTARPTSVPTSTATPTPTTTPTDTPTCRTVCDTCTRTITDPITGVTREESFDCNCRTECY